jgi:hypothetical protein
VLTFNRRKLLRGVGWNTLLAFTAWGAPVALLAASNPIARPGVILNGFNPSDFPFRNLMLGASDIKAGSFAFPSILDDSGYPTATPAIPIGGTLPVPTSYRGRYVVAWVGTGRFQLSFGGQPNQIVVYSGGANVVGLRRNSGTLSYNLTVDGTNPQVEFAFTGNSGPRWTFSFPASGNYSGMSNLVLCRSSGSYTGDLAAIKSGALENCFNDDFVSKVRALKPAAIRPMDWIGVNNSNVTQSRYLPRRGYLTVADTRWLKKLWAGVAVGADAFTCGPAAETPPAWSDGETIQCQFQNANIATPILGATNNGHGLVRLQLASTNGLSSGQRVCVNAYNVTGGQQGGGVWTIGVVDATSIDLLHTFGGVPSVFVNEYVSGGSITTATLDVNSRGPKLITSRSGGKDNSPNATGPSIAANAIGTLVYDATFDVLMYRSSGLNNGVSVDVAVALANKLDTGLWYCMPHMMNDAGIASTVSFIRDRLNVELPCYLEYSNEVWNFIFDQTVWGMNRGIALKFPKDNARREYGWYALRTRQIMGIASSTWGNRSGLIRVMAVQFFGATSGNNIYRFQGADLGSFGYHVAPNRPIDYVDAIAYAPYYSGAVLTNFDGNYSRAGLDSLTQAADDFASGDEARMTSALSWVDADIRAGKRNGALGANTLASFVSTKYPGWEALAANHSKFVVCYEGGYEGKPPSIAACASLGIEAAYGGANGSIATLLRAYKNNSLFRRVVLDQWKQFSSLPHSKAPSWYTFGGGIQWSMFPADLYTTPYQSYNAMQEFAG